MNKPYTLVAVVNGIDLPSKRYHTYQEAFGAMSRLMDNFNLQLSDEYSVGDERVFRMEQYRSWFHIQCDL